MEGNLRIVNVADRLSHTPGMTFFLMVHANQLKSELDAILELGWVPSPLMRLNEIDFKNMTPDVIDSILEEQISQPDSFLWLRELYLPDLSFYLDEAILCYNTGFYGASCSLTFSVIERILNVKQNPGKTGNTLAVELDDFVENFFSSEQDSNYKFPEVEFLLVYRRCRKLLLHDNVFKSGNKNRLDVRNRNVVLHGNLDLVPNRADALKLFNLTLMLSQTVTQWKAIALEV